MQARVLVLALVLPAILFFLARPGSQVATVYVARAKADLDRDEFDDAIDWCNRALAIDPKSAAAYLDRAIAWMREGDDDKSVADFKQALAISPNDWEILNNLGVECWNMAQKEDKKAAAAESAGDKETAEACRRKSAAFKGDAIALWTHGIKSRPTAPDVHGSTPYVYTEDLDRAERHLSEVLRLNPRDARAHNNFGRVLLRKSQEFEMQAGEAVAQVKTDPSAVGKAKQFKAEAKEKRSAAIEQFEKAVELAPAMLEARLNLGEVYTQSG